MGSASPLTRGWVLSTLLVLVLLQPPYSSVLDESADETLRFRSMAETLQAS